MSQATLSGGPYRNSNLFSNYFLNSRVQHTDGWDCDDEAESAFENLKRLWEDEGEFVGAYNEDELLDHFIDEVLDVLGFKRLAETPLPDGGGFVDRVLIGSADNYRAAVHLKGDGDVAGAYGRGLCVLEAKQWDHDFEKHFSEQRQYRNASHQVKHYLERTPSNIQWGILTNGRKWRLYGTKDYETQTYYEVDLPEVITTDDLEAFKYFYALFRPDAFREVAETTYLDRIWSESETAAQELGEDLQDNVFKALRVLGRGFVTDNDLDIDPDDVAALDDLKEQSLVLLYRLMFILYAEDRGLIHPSDPGAEAEYEQNFSLRELRSQIDDELETGSFGSFSEYATTYWTRLEDLFDLINTGNDELGIPPYNGGLFDPDQHAFLAENEVSNRTVAEVVYRLSTTWTDDGAVPADYADLDTRHLGSIYEGLLEHHFRIAPERYVAVPEDGGQVWKPATEASADEFVEYIEPGGLYVVNDDGERKASGAYYTPDYVVTYIVEETVDPLLADIREDLEDDGLERGTEEYAYRFADRVLELTVLDPAMGSGHFLTKATGYLAEQVMNAVTEAELDTVFREEQVKRRVAKQCIYGVDLNEMAVELAKLSMWLETLAADQPLAFLDHHLKCGNSLVGSDIETIEGLQTGKSADRPEDETHLGQYLDTKQGTIEELMRTYQDFLAIENEDLDDVKAMERKYREIEQDDLRQRLVSMANVQTADDFGVDVPSGAYEQMARSLEDDEEWAGLEEMSWFAESQKLSREKDAFHWKLEFPEVFYDAEGFKRDSAGYDVVIGNPPYVRIYRGRLPEKDVEYYRTKYKSAYKKFDLYVLFLELSIDLIHGGGTTSQIVPDKFMNTPYGEKLREIILERTSIESILDLRDTVVFKDASVSNVIPLLRKTPSEEGETELRERSPTGYNVVNCIPASLFSSGSDNTFRPRIRREDAQLIERIRSNSIRFDEIYYVNWGLRTGTKEKTDEYIVEETEDPRAEPLIRGKDVANRYRLLPYSEYIIYEPDDFYNPMFTELFESPKIVFRKITGEGIMAVADEKSLYCFSTLIPCVNIQYIKDVDRAGIPDATSASSEYKNIYFALSIVNSTLVRWYYQKTLSDDLSVVPGHVSELPIPEIEFESEAPSRETITDVLDQFLEGSNETPIADYRKYTADNPEALKAETGTYKILSELAEQLTAYNNSYVKLNLSIRDYLGTYSDGPKLADLTPHPPEDIADSILTETTKTHETLRVGSVEIERDENALTILLSARYKPEKVDTQETDQWGYAETRLVSAMRFNDLDDAQADLIESFVPVAVKKADGFAGFREKATKTISLIDRLEALTLPALEDVEDGLERYRENVARAEELDEKIEKTDRLIDEIVYELYGLTDEEVEVVEEAVSG